MTIEQPHARIRHRKLQQPAGATEIWLEKAGPQVTMHTLQPNGSGASHWKCCSVDGCVGEAIVAHGKCLRHADPAARDHYLNTLRSGTRLLSLRGVSVTQELLDTLLRSTIVEDKKVLVALSFSGADVAARMDFVGYTFERTLEFTGATLHAPAVFQDCLFKQTISARFTFFNSGPPSFTNSTFHGGTDLSHAHAKRVSIGFSNCSFSQSLVADGIRLGREKKPLPM